MRDEIEEDYEQAEDAAVRAPLSAKRPVPAWGWIAAAILIGACSAIIVYAIYQVWTR